MEPCNAVLRNHEEKIIARTKLTNYKILHFTWDVKYAGGSYCLADHNKPIIITTRKPLPPSTEDNRFTIWVKTLTGKIIELDVRANYPVEYLKLQIQSKRLLTNSRPTKAYLLHRGGWW